MVQPPRQILQADTTTPYAPPHLGTIGLRFIPCRFRSGDPANDRPTTTHNGSVLNPFALPHNRQVTGQGAQLPYGTFSHPPHYRPPQHNMTVMRSQNAPLQHLAQHPSGQTTQQIPHQTAPGMLILPPSQPTLGLTQRHFPAAASAHQVNQPTASILPQQRRPINSPQTLASPSQGVQESIHHTEAYWSLYVWEKFQHMSPEELRLLDYEILGGFLPDKFAKSSLSFLAQMDGQVYAIRVLSDQEERKYYLNEAMLKQVPGLAPALEHGKWSESSTKELDFTEDDASAVARLVDYLYTGGFDPRSRIVSVIPDFGLSGEENVTAALELVDFYCLLDRLCFQKPMFALRLKMKYLRLSPKEFLKVATKLYDRLPCKTQGPEMKSWVKEYTNLNAKHLNQLAEIETIMNNRGQLAWDVHRSLMR